MKIVCLQKRKNRGLILVDQNTGLPCIAASVWISLYEYKYSESYLRKKLYAISRFYNHVTTRLNKPKSLDKLLLDYNIDELERQLRSFLSELQNQSKQTQVNNSRLFKHVIGFIIDISSEFAARSSTTNKNTNLMIRRLQNLKSLYRFLRPERKNPNLTIRSIPISVTDEVFSIVAPSSPSNPYRTEKLKRRNFLIISLLYFMGLRRGELLSLETNAFVSEFSPTDKRQLFWLNIKEPSQIDTRLQSPKLKNEFSPRQIPLPEALYFGCLDYVSNWRGRCSNGFLINTSAGNPITHDGFSDILTRLNKFLSKKSKAELKYVTGLSTFSPHSFRHSAAVNRIRSYRKEGYEISEAEAMMRSFFGWSYTSEMPRRYAKAYYQEQISTTWFDQNNHYLDGFRNG